MACRHRIIAPAQARATVAAALLAPPDPRRLGSIELEPHQCTAVLQLRRLIGHHGGALLADDVGLGKTYVALAVAARYRHVVAVVPAALRAMWASSCQRANVRATLLSYEELSRGTPLLHDADLVILDEAHHARSTKSQRYPRIVALTARAHTLLLTATPVPNRVAELRALFALFLGQHADALDPAALGALIVRRCSAAVPSAVLPRAGVPQWIESGDDAACLAQLERLPPAVPAADEGDAGALVLLGLVRQWASSRAALVAALRRRAARAIALEAALTAGRLPTAGELRAWHAADATIQLAFPELMASSAVASADGARLLASITAHRSALEALLTTIDGTADPDRSRARALLELRRRHPDARVLCFTSYAETAFAYWRQLRHHPRVAHLTARGGLIASGALSRTEVLNRFAPLGQRVAPPRAAEQITLLVTTDILSEGLDLRDATVVVHLDLPWSPARLEQRVGRARRLGSTAAAIGIYAMRPPANTEVLVRIERRLRAKIGMAAEMVGASGLVLPSPSINASSSSPPECRSRLLDRIASWASAPDAVASGGAIPVAAAVTSAQDGWFALVDIDGAHMLVAQVDGAIDEAPCVVERAAIAAEGADATATAPLVARAIQAARRYALERAAAGCIGTVAGGAIRGRTLRRIHSAYASAKPVRRTAVAGLAAAARAVVTGRLTAGVERELALLCDAPLDDDAWLRAVTALGTDGRDVERRVAVGVVIVLVAGPARAARELLASRSAPASATPS